VRWPTGCLVDSERLFSPSQNSVWLGLFLRGACRFPVDRSAVAIQHDAVMVRSAAQDRTFGGYPCKDECEELSAGYLQPVLRHDADAITRAIAQLREALRSGGDEHRGPRQPSKPPLHWRRRLKATPTNKPLRQPVAFRLSAPSSSSNYAMFAAIRRAASPVLRPRNDQERKAIPPQ
jgi:hypothetical protein